MPSRLRFQLAVDPVSTGIVRQALSQPAPKKLKMSVTQTYFLAASARSKLGHEASKHDLDLRRLVGHANLLDFLMLDLREAEREEDAWFHHNVQKSAGAEPTKHLRWADTIVEELEVEDSDESESDDDDDDSDIAEEDLDLSTHFRRIRNASERFRSQNEPDDADVVFHDDEDVPELALVRTQSRSVGPPELVDDSDSSEDDESPPASPPHPTFDFDKLAQRQRAGIKEAVVDDGFFIPNERHAPMIAAF